MYNKTVKMMHQFCISLDTPVHNLTFLQDSVYQDLFKSVDIWPIYSKIERGLYDFEELFKQNASVVTSTDLH